MLKSRNLLINLMTNDIREDLLGIGRPFIVPAGHRIAADELSGEHVFIVTAGVASQMLIAPDGRPSEIGMVGRESLFPLSAILYVPSAMKMVVVHVGPLEGMCVRTKDFHRILSGSDDARTLVRKAGYAYITQLASNILTVEQNTVGARLARWLMMCHDRILGNAISVTHDVLAQMVGSHRPTITNALHQMERENMIALARGQVTIRDRHALRILADGSYGQSEDYWRQHIGDFGKDTDPATNGRMKPYSPAPLSA